jgi:hypothetical protein
MRALHNVSAAALGRVTPGNDEGPTVAAAGPLVVDQSNDLDSATTAAENKAFQTLRARLARAGHALSRTDADDGARSYFVSRWGMVRELRTLDDVQRFAEQVGVTHE